MTSVTLGPNGNNVSVQQLQEAMHNLLNSREQGEFIQVLNDYHARRNIHDFAFALRGILDTPAKRQIVNMLRRVIPRQDIHQFDQLMDGYDVYTVPRKSGSAYRAHSTISAPTHYYQTLPTSGAKTVRPRHSMNHTSRPGKPLSAADLPQWETGAVNTVKTVVIEPPPNSSQGLGFSIRGGAEHGIGIYVSYVDVDSVAERHGLVPGDQLLAVNGVAFQRISHDEAAKIIRSSKKLELQVRNVGRVPGSFETHQTYTWVDPLGRTVSPPPEIDRVGRYEATGERRSGLMLLKDSDERKVNVVVSENKILGLMIRGGNEYGLGIYITGVDRGSVAENAGLKVGDQILDVNGQSYLDISHEDAVKTLKSSKHMMLTIKDIGKLPYARTTFDQTEWVSHQQLPPKKTPKPKIITTIPHEPPPSINGVFSKGAGSQLMHNSIANQHTTRGMIDEQARQLLNENERATMNYYMEEYLKGHVTVDALVLALFELLNTQAKFSLTTEIRGLIAPKDIERFDALVLKKEVEAMKSRSADSLFADHMSTSSLDNLSSNSHFTGSSARESWEGSVSSGHFIPPRVPITLPPHKLIEDDWDPLRIAIGQINDDTAGLPDYFGEDDFEQPSTSSYQPSKSTYPPTDANTSVVVAEVHNSPGGKSGYEDMRSPSEDSGVEVNGGANGESHGHSSRVTVSQNDPVIINDSLRNSYGHLRGVQGGRFSPTASRRRGRSESPPLHRRERFGNPQEEIVYRSSARILEAQPQNSLFVRGRSPNRELETQTVTLTVSPEHEMYRIHYEPQYQTLEEQQEQRRVVHNNHHGNVTIDNENGGYGNGHHVGQDFNDGEGRLSERDSHFGAQVSSNIAINHRLSRDINRVQNTDEQSSRDNSPVRYSERIERSRSSQVESRDVGPAQGRAQNYSPHRDAVQTRKDYSSTYIGQRWLQPDQQTNRDLTERTSRSDAQFRDSSTSGNIGRVLTPTGYVPKGRDMSLSPNREHGGREVGQSNVQDSDIYDEIRTPSPSSIHMNGDARLDQRPPQPMPRSQPPSSNQQPRQQVPEIQEPEPGDQILDGKVEEVTVYKTKPTLGIAIEGGANTRQPMPRIINIQPGGSAYESGGLKVGHLILEINGKSLRGLEHRQCAKVIAEAFKNKRSQQMELLVMDTSKLKL